MRQIGPGTRSEPPLVVIHGGPSWDHSYLLPGLVPVSRKRDVVLFDLRGCGRSSRDLGSAAYQPEFLVDDLAGLLGVLGLEGVDLLGFSTGGQVAQLFAEAHPERIRRLVLASTTAFPAVESFLAGWQEYERRRASAPVTPGGLDDLQTTIRWAVDGATTAIWNLDLLDEYLALLSRVRFSGDWLEPFQHGRLHPWRPRDPARVLTELAKPILILHGAQDMAFPIQVAERLHRAVPNSRLHVVEQAGHMVQFEQPTRWSGAIVEFLSG